MKAARLSIRLVVSLVAFSSVAGLSVQAAGPRGAVPADWKPAAMQRIAAEEYEVTWQPSTVIRGLDAAWHAPNRSQDLRTYFTGRGIRVVRRTTDAPTWVLGLEWSGYGRGGRSWAVAPAVLAAKGARIDYHRGPAAEWYENSPRGLKQGFVLAAPPEESRRADGGDAQAPVTGPPGAGRQVAAERLAHLDLLLTGDVRPVISADGQAIDFTAPGGACVVHYAELRVTDARGAVLPSWFEGYVGADGGGIRIVIDDTDAVYPVTVDPLATSAAWAGESDQAGASFGWFVATAGDVNGDGNSDVIVGAPNYDNGQTDEGRAYVYLGAPSGLSATPAWMVESNAAYGLLGRSAGTAGDVNGDGYSDVIVGAPYITNDQTNEGRAFVYLGSSTGLSTTPAWTREGDQASAYFGTSVGTAGDVNGDGYADVIVGAESYDNGQTDEGRAFVYLGSAAGLPSSPVWTGESDQANARFGIAVQTAGDVNCDGYADVIVGAHAYDNGQTDEGRAFVYLGSASGPLSTASWTAESDQATAYFGFSVGTAGDVNGDGYADVVVGAYAYDGTITNEGRASVYLGSASGLPSSPAWTVAGAQGWAIFGYSVGTAGDVNGDGYADVIVGAYNYDNGQTDEGRAFVYLGSRTGLSTTPAWTAESDQASAAFGYSVGTAGDVNGDGYSDVIVGAANYDNGQSDEGRASVYLGGASGISTVDLLGVYTGQTGEKFGSSIAGAGDVNGDGYADIVVGAPWYDGGEVDEGRAVAYLGSHVGLSTSIAWSVEGGQANALFGAAVAGAGDVNGDGYSDVAVGAYLYDNGQTDEGRAFVYHGGAAGLATSPAWTAEPDNSEAWFGYAISTAGDVNGDGYGDLIVGAPQHTHGAYTKAGRASVYLGSATGLAASPVWYEEIDIGYVNLGSSVAGGGDFNGDGFDDILVGANLMTYGGQLQEGYVRVYKGALDGIDDRMWNALQADQAYAEFGTSVAWAGDVNGDGYADAVVGAPKFDASATDDGRVFLFHGNAVKVSETIAWSADGGQAGAYLGAAVAGVGDVNGDGYADVIVGAPFYDNGQTDEGKASVYLGSAAGIAASPDFTLEGNSASANLGGSLAPAGDVNGDGFADVLFGMSGYDTPATDAGRVYLLYGGGGRGVVPHPRQLRTSAGTTIAQHGMSDTADGFRIALLNRSPFGRTRSRLEWEVKALRTPFDGNLTGRSSTWRDTGASGTDVNEPVTGLAPGLRWHWRARFQFDAARTPFQPHGRWVTIPWNGALESDLRTRVVTHVGVYQTDEDPVMAGEDVVYSILVSNTGTDAAAITLRDTMPDGTTYLWSGTTQGSCSRSYQIVTCALGMVGAGERATVEIAVATATVGFLANEAVAWADGRADGPAGSSWTESTTVVAPSVGDRVFQDLDADGLQDPGEPGLAGVVVAAYGQNGSLAGATGTDASGNYSLAGLTYGQTYSLRFTPPEGLVFSRRDAGSDDALDSDVDPATWRTAQFSLTDSSDMSRWDAGLTVDADGDGYTPWFDDCADDDPAVHPGAPQVCDGQNNDCSDPSWPALRPDDRDLDGDGYRTCSGDCNDAALGTHPGASEVCDGEDNDCDGVVDEGCDAQCDLPAEIGNEHDLSPESVGAGAPRLVSTGSGYGMIFTDIRDGNSEVYFALLDAALNKVGNDARVSTAAGISTTPQIAWTGTDFGVVWQDDRDGNQEIYFVRLSSSGVKLTGEVRVTNAAGNSRIPRIAWSGSDFGVLWNDSRDGSFENYFVRLDEYGQPLGAERRITATPLESSAARFAWTGTLYGVAWNDFRDGDWEVYFTALDRNGETVTPETRITTSTGTSRGAAIAWDSARSEFGIVWVDGRAGPEQLYFTRLAADGSRITGDHALGLFVPTGSVVASLVHSGGEYAIAWLDESAGNSEVYFARLAGDALSGDAVRLTDDPAVDQNPSIEWSGSEYVVAFADNRAGGSVYHPFAARIGCCTVSSIGDRVWRDVDSDGIQDAGELAGVADTIVALYDADGWLIDAASTPSDGRYSFDGLSCGSTYELRFFPPGTEYLVPRDQGGDETLDSDPDPQTGSTGLFTLRSTADATGWDAGIAACWPPDEPVYIASVRRTADGNDYPILDFLDPNQAQQVTGYNVYRSDTAGAPWPWPVVATDVVDMDEATPNIQWIDTTGDVPPSGAWFYQVAAYNHQCAREGPR